MSTVFVIARHAESTWNAAGLWQGHADPPLSRQGQTQARHLARALSGESLDVIVSSDLQRARRTAEIVAQALGLAPQVEPRLRELDVGRWEGWSRARIEVREAGALARFDSQDPDAAAGGGESRRDLERRVFAAVADLARAHAGLRIGIVTHLGVIRALLPGMDLGNADFLCVAQRCLPSASDALAGVRA